MRLLLAVAVVLAACGTADGDVAPPTSDEAAAVVAVVDGDTMRVRLAGSEIEVRLDGINAPEAGECFADEARTALTLAAGDAVTLAASQPDRDQYGRMLAYVSTDGVILNRLMLQQGAAMATSGDHDLVAEFLADDEEAFVRGIGMWGRGVCRPAADPGVYISALEPDAPGSDADNPNGETVVLATRHTVDLSGWVLRDESSVHRFRFPAGTSLVPGESLSIHSGCGQSASGVAHWCASGAVWNNDGDTALLLDAAGRIVDRWRYGSGR